MAVLVAIAIPVFTAQLEKSREAVDAANIRSAYAEFMADKITGEVSTDGYVVEIKQEKGGWDIKPEWPANLDVTAIENVASSSTAKVTVEVQAVTDKNDKTHDAKVVIKG